MTAHPLPPSLSALHPASLQQGASKVDSRQTPAASGPPSIIPAPNTLARTSSTPETNLVDHLSELPPDLQNVLRNLPFFPRSEKSEGMAGLDDFLMDISEVMHIRHFSPGDVVIKEGEKSRAMFFVIKGVVKVISEDGEINFAELRPGSYFGEIGVLFSVKRTATVTAKTRCTLAVLTSDELEMKLVPYPAIHENLRARANERFEVLKREMEKAGRRLDMYSGDKVPELNKEMSHGSLRELSASRIGSRRGSAESGYATPVSTPDPSSGLGRSTTDDFTTSALGISVDVASPPSSSSVPPSPGSDSGSGSLNTQASGFAARYGAKRRASVAVWSDDRLMQFAQSASEKAEQNREKHAPKVSSNLQQAATLTSSYAVLSIPSGIEASGYGLLGRDLMARILHYLDFRQRMRIRLSSMHILRLLLDPRSMLTTEVDLSPWHKRIDDKVIADILCFCGQTVRNLSLRNCWSVTDKGLGVLAHFATRVEVLCLASVWEVTDVGIGSLVRMCSQLRDLDLSNCRRLGDAGVYSVLEHCSGMENLTLSYCKNLSDGVLGHWRWKTVKRLNLQRCTGIRDGGFGTWATTLALGADGSAEGHGDENPQTESSSYFVTGDEIRPGNEEAMEVDEELAAQENSWGTPSPIFHPRSPANSFALQELILSDCSFLTDATVAAVAASCHNLQILSLSFCCALTDAFAENLRKGCPDLRALDMSFCGSAVTDASLLTLSQGLRRLERLSIRGCVQVTERGIMCLARYARHLRMLNVSQCKNVSIAAVERTGRGWRLLTCEGLVEVDETTFRLNGGKEVGKAPGRRERARASTA